MATNETVKQINSGGTLRDVEDTTARAAIAMLQSALDAITNGDSTAQVIDTFNEVVAFLANTSDTSTLQGIIAGLNTAIAAKYTKPGTGIPATDLAQAVRDLLALAGTALQASALNGYVTTSTLEGYYTKSEVNGLIPDISGKANKSEMAVADNNNGTVTITLKTGTSATVLTQHQSLAGYAGKNGSSSEHFNTDELYVHGDGETVNFYVGLDANDNPVLHISSSNGGDVSIPFGANGLTGQIATKNDLVSIPIVDGSAMANETAKGLSPIVSAAQSITIDAGKYYDFGERPLSGESGLAIFPKEQTEDGSNAYSYVGRFTIDDSFSGTFQFAMIAVRKDSGGNVLEGDETGDFAFKLPDEVEFEAGHTYEYNILYDVCFIKDITVEEGS